MTSIAWFDLVVLGILVLATIRGAIKGVIWQLAAIAAILLCFFFAETLSMQLAPHIGVDPPLNRWVAMFLLYVGFSFLSFGAARVMREWIDRMKFHEFDRHLGAMFGFVKGALFSLVVIFFIVTMSESRRQDVMESRSGYVAAIVMDRLHVVMPAELHDVLEPYIHQLDRPGMDLRFGSHDGSANHSDGDHDHADGHASETNSSLAGFVDGLRTIIDGDLRALVMQALENTDPANREELMARLSSASPETIQGLATEWQNGRPSAEAIDSMDRHALLDQISSLYFDLPDDRQKMVEDIELALVDVPQRIALAVLRDWHSDLMVLDPDPDPETGVTTPLDARIVRQLSLAGIPLRSLDSALGNRLRESSLR